MQYASLGTKFANWEIPEGISQMEVCDSSGLLPSKYCPSIVNEIFLKGFEPTQYDTLYYPVQIDRETGNLATILTPPDMIDERTFIHFPAQAKTWSKEYDFNIPPQKYDVLYYGKKLTSHATITSPLVFDYIHGIVEISGNAYGDNFDFYILQAGRGINPKQWLEIDSKKSALVQNGVLGTWNTNGLNGLYILQLLLVDKKQKVDIFTTQVTIDNHPPMIQHIFPAQGQTYSTMDFKNITLQADVHDDIGLQSVSIFVDNKLIKTFFQPPYSVIWNTDPGNKTIKVVAVDKAGNSTEKETQFTLY
jgi:hypothetical protein